MAPQANIVQSGKIFEQVQVLKCPGNSRVSNAVWRPTADISAVEDQATCVSPADARKSVEDCCLAGAVGPDQPQDFVSLQAQA